jgi:hypothetical protein
MLVIVSNEFGMRSYRSMQKREQGIFAKFFELARPRVLWLMGY